MRGLTPNVASLNVIKSVNLPSALIAKINLKYD